MRFTRGLGVFGVFGVDDCYLSQCWTVGTIFTFGRSRMFGPEKLRPLAVAEAIG